MKESVLSIKSLVDNARGFAEIIRALEGRIEYRVVGSAAVYAITGEEEIEPRDVDIICFSGERKTIQSDQFLFDKIHRKSLSTGEFCPRVDLSLGFEIEGSPRGTVNIPSFLRILRSIERNRKGYFLIYGQIRAEIPDKLMEVNIVQYRGVSFKTFFPETLLHLYITRGGCLKPKDLAKVRSLARYIQFHPTPGLTHKDFRVFHKFATDMRYDYPFQTGLYRFLNLLDYLGGGMASGNFLAAKVYSKLES